MAPVVGMMIVNRVKDNKSTYIYIYIKNIPIRDFMRIYVSVSVVIEAWFDDTMIQVFYVHTDRGVLYSWMWV